MSRLRELVVLAGLENELDSATAQRTIFAPSNQAFEEYEQLAPLVDLTDPVEVRDLLQRHIATGSYTTQNLFTLDCLRMQNADPFLMPINDDDTIGSNNVSLDPLVATPDVESANGYLHAINKVLAPSTEPCPAP